MQSFLSRAYQAALSDGLTKDYIQYACGLYAKYCEKCLMDGTRPMTFQDWMTIAESAS